MKFILVVMSLTLAVGLGFVLVSFVIIGAIAFIKAFFDNIHEIEDGLGFGFISYTILIAAVTWAITWAWR